MKVAFDNGILFAEADTLGAELMSIRLNGTEKLWQGSAWPHHAPVLFPVCGNCDLRLNGKQYALDRHGFARKSEFVLRSKRKTSVCFELRSNQQTKACYPFDFCFRVKYSLRGACLNITYEVENCGGKPMYFSCGGHESFALSRPLEEYELQFSQREKFVHLPHDEDGRLTGDQEELGAGTRLPIPPLAGGNTLILGALRSRRVKLCERDGKALAQISFAGFSNLLLWRVGEEKMICIEPWHNLPDGRREQEFSEKKGIITLPPHALKKFVRKIEYLD